MTRATDAAPLLAVASDVEGDRLRDALPDCIDADAVVDAASHEGPLGGLFAGAATADRD